MPFKSTYADAYDNLYKDKDYDQEVNLILDYINKSGIPVNSIVDIGCGTGEHAIKLAKEDNLIIGIDPSEDMLKIASQKIINNQLENLIQLKNDYASNFVLDKKADFAIMMFAVIGYHNSNDEILNCLKNIRKNLNIGSTLMFDFWYGPAVLTNNPSDKIKTIDTDNNKTLRLTKPVHKHFNHIVEVNFETFHINNNTILDHSNELHSMRYFFPQEILFYLENSGFELIELSEFPSLDKKLSTNSWNALCVARAK
tara:strand:+ start:11325 stop:12089 length:765 start_codon:yes stop_codon:yes gene_type:complete